MASIFRLPSPVISQLRSGTVIMDLAQAVEELICNSLDAAATIVTLHIDSTTAYLKVEDNGYGISREDLKVIGQRHATSKIRTLEDLESGPSTLGFRGEALSSIADVALIEVTTCQQGSAMTYCKILKGGNTLSIGLSSHQRTPGTTVTVKDIFFNQPVRRRRLMAGLQKEVHSAKERVVRLALMHPSVSFTLVDVARAAEVLRTKSGGSMLSTIHGVFGEGLSSTLLEANSSKGHYKLSGYLARPREGHASKTYQYFYINGRFVQKTRIHKLINSHFASCFDSKNTSDQGTAMDMQGSSPARKPAKESAAMKGIVKRSYPAFFLNLSCPLSEYDVTFEATKVYVEFKDWAPVLAFIRYVLVRAWGNPAARTLPTEENLGKVSPSRSAGVSIGADQLSPPRPGKRPRTEKDIAGKRHAQHPTKQTSSSGMWHLNAERKQGSFGLKGLEPTKSSRVAAADQEANGAKQLSTGEPDRQPPCSIEPEEINFGLHANHLHKSQSYRSQLASYRRSSSCSLTETFQDHDCTKCLSPALYEINETRMKERGHADTLDKFAYEKQDMRRPSLELSHDLADSCLAQFSEARWHTRSRPVRLGAEGKELFNEEARRHLEYAPSLLAGDHPSGMIGEREIVPYRLDHHSLEAPRFMQDPHDRESVRALQMVPTCLEQYHEHCLGHLDSPFRIESAREQRTLQNQTIHAEDHRLWHSSDGGNALNSWSSPVTRKSAGTWYARSDTDEGFSEDVGGKHRQETTHWSSEVSGERWDRAAHLRSDDLETGTKYRVHDRDKRDFDGTQGVAGRLWRERSLDSIRSLSAEASYRWDRTSSLSLGASEGKRPWLEERGDCVESTLHALQPLSADKTVQCWADCSLSLSPAVVKHRSIGGQRSQVSGASDGASKEPFACLEHSSHRDEEDVFGRDGLGGEGKYHVEGTSGERKDSRRRARSAPPFYRPRKVIGAKGSWRSSALPHTKAKPCGGKKNPDDLESPAKKPRDEQQCAQLQRSKNQSSAKYTISHQGGEANEAGDDASKLLPQTEEAEARQNPPINWLVPAGEAQVQTLEEKEPQPAQDLEVIYNCQDVVLHECPQASECHLSKWREGAMVPAPCETVAEPDRGTVASMYSVEKANVVTLMLIYIGVLLLTLLSWQNPCFVREERDILDVGAVPMGSSSSRLLPGSLTKEVFQNAQVLQQVDKKFIAVVAGDVLVIVDQHAADERVHLEELREQVLDPNRTHKPVLLDRSTEMMLTLGEGQALKTYHQKVEAWGWRFKFIQGSCRGAGSSEATPGQSRVLLIAVPCLLGAKLTAKDLNEYLRQLMATEGASSAPPAVIRLLNSKACRGAIMFGDSLQKWECQQLVEQLKHTRLLFQCAHGRPTMVPIVNLGVIRQKFSPIHEVPPLWGASRPSNVSFEDQNMQGNAEANDMSETPQDGSALLQERLVCGSSRMFGIGHCLERSRISLERAKERLDRAQAAFPQ